MKKTILLFTLLIISITLSAQEVFIITATHFTSCKIEPNKPTQWDDWEDLNAIITMNFKDQTIRIDGKTHENIKFFDIFSQKSGEDKDDGKWAEAAATAVDNEGVKCTVVIKSYGDGERAISVQYKNFAYTYQGTVVAL